MTRFSPAFLRITILLLLTAFGGFGNSCCCDDESGSLVGSSGDDDDGLPWLALEIYRCGTDFNCMIRDTAEDVPVVLGDGGIILTRLESGGRYVPFSPGIPNNMIARKGSAIYVTEGLQPDEPGLILYPSSGAWFIYDHPATGHFTDAESFLVTSAGEVLWSTVHEEWIVVFELPGDAGLTGTETVGRRSIVVGPGGVAWQGDLPLESDNWLDAEWTNVSIPGGPDLFDVHGYQDVDTGQSIFYAVGANAVWSRHGDADWVQEVFALPGALFTVTAKHDLPLWAAGSNGLIFTGDGESWDHTVLASGVHLRGIFVYGTGQACGDDGTLVELIQNEWVDLGYSNVSSWNDIDGLSATEVYAANGDTLMTWDGGDWSPLAISNDELHSIWPVATNEIWALTCSEDGWDNFLLEWDGGQFWLRGHSSMDALNGLWSDAAGDTVMVASGNGYVHHYDSGYLNPLEADPLRRDLFGIDGTSGHDVFAVGSDGVIVHFDGDVWTEMASGVTATLRAISGAVAVGDYGAVTRFDGSNWYAEDAGITDNLNAVWFYDDANIWAVGDGGVVIHYDGTAWTAYERSLYTVALKAIWGIGPEDMWFGGEEGYLLRWRP